MHWKNIVIIHLFILPTLSAQSIEELKAAATKGDLEAINHLGYAYERGEQVPLDLQEAVKYYKRAAQLGYAKAQSNLGNSYLLGNGVGKDTSEAVKWYGKAAAQAYAQAQYNLGVLSEKGWGMQPADVKKAVEWYQKAAQNDHSKAMNNLAIAYLEGRGVEKDLQKAFYWSEKSAQAGFGYGQALVGQLYLSGNGVRPDRIKARYWLRRALEQAVPNIEPFFQQAAPENASEQAGKMADDLCQKFTGPATLKPAQRSFERFHFFAQQIFEPTYPDFQQLTRYAPKEEVEALQKRILIQTFELCPAFWEKYAYTGEEQSSYSILNSMLCNCVSTRYNKMVTRKMDFKDAIWRGQYAQCMQQYVQTDTFFKNELNRGVLDYAQRKNIRSQKAAEPFAQELAGYFYARCSFLHDKYAQIIVDTYQGTREEVLCAAPERLQNIYEMLQWMKENKKNLFKNKFKSEENLVQYSKQVDNLIKILQKPSQVSPLLVRQKMTAVGMEETFALVQPVDKNLQYILKLTFDKKDNMDKLLQLEVWSKKEVAKKDWENWQAMVRQSRLPVEKF